MSRVELFPGIIEVPFVTRRSTLRKGTHFTCLARHRIAAVAATGHKVRVSFALPYRCKFGQHICIVGESEALGSWDVHRGVAMNWTAGDVWQAQLDIEADAQLKLEYKYVVRDDTGTALYWKPGENCNLRVDDSANVVRVSDDWESSFSIIEVDSHSVPKATSGTTQLFGNSLNNKVKPPSREAKPKLTEAKPPTAVKSSVVFPPVEPTAEPSSSIAPSDKKQTERPPKERFIVDEIDIVAQAADRALQELDDTIAESIELIESLENPTNEEAFAADRLVAAAARKAMALSKALSAADPGYNYRFLKPPKKPVAGIEAPKDDP